MELQTENDRIKHESAVMVQNYSRQLESKEETIRSMGQRLEASQGDQEVESIVRRENEAIKQENRMLREKVGDLSRDLDMAANDRAGGSVVDALENENRRLRSDLADKEREF